MGGRASSTGRSRGSSSALWCHRSRQSRGRGKLAQMRVAEPATVVLHAREDMVQCSSGASAQRHSAAREDNTCQGFASSRGLRGGAITCTSQGNDDALQAPLGHLSPGFATLSAAHCMNYCNVASTEAILFFLQRGLHKAGAAD